MSIGDELIQSINNKGTSPLQIAKFLKELRDIVEKEGTSSELILPLKKIENAYRNMYIYYEPNETVLKNLDRRITGILPLLNKALEGANKDETKAIMAIVENQKILKKLSPTNSIWENFINMVNNSLRSPLESDDD